MLSTIDFESSALEIASGAIQCRTMAGARDTLAAANEVYEQLGDFHELDHEATHLFRAPAESWPHCDVAAGVLTCVAARMLSAGQPFGISEEGGGCFQVIEPKAGAPGNSSGTSGEFGFHTDNAALPLQFQPQIISLTCMNNEAHAETGLVSVDEIGFRLSPALRSVAFQSRFSHVVPPSFGDVCVGRCEPRPLFYEREGRLRCAMTTYRTFPATPGDSLAHKVIESITEIAEQCAVWVDLQPGNILFFRNDSVLHGRREIRGRRRLLRAYWRRSLAEFRMCAATSDSHVFSAASAMRAGLPSWR